MNVDLQKQQESVLLTTGDREAISFIKGGLTPEQIAILKARLDELEGKNEVITADNIGSENFNVLVEYCSTIREIVESGKELTPDQNKINEFVKKNKDLADNIVTCLDIKEFVSLVFGKVNYAGADKKSIESKLEEIKNKNKENKLVINYYSNILEENVNQGLFKLKKSDDLDKRDNFIIRLAIQEYIVLKGENKDRAKFTSMELLNKYKSYSPDAVMPFIDKENTVKEEKNIEKKVLTAEQEMKFKKEILQTQEINKQTEKLENFESVKLSTREILKLAEEKVDWIIRGLGDFGIKGEAIVKIPAKIKEELAKGPEKFESDQYNFLSFIKTGIGYFDSDVITKKDTQMLDNCILDLVGIYQQLCSTELKETSKTGRKLTDIENQINSSIGVLEVASVLEEHIGELKAGKFNYENGELKIGSATYGCGRYFLGKAIKSYFGGVLGKDISDNMSKEKKYEIVNKNYGELNKILKGWYGSDFGNFLLNDKNVEKDPNFLEQPLKVVQQAFLSVTIDGFLKNNKLKKEYFGYTASGHYGKRFVSYIKLNGEYHSDGVYPMLDALGKTQWGKDFFLNQLNIKNYEESEQYKAQLVKTLFQNEKKSDKDPILPMLYNIGDTKEKIGKGNFEIALDEEGKNKVLINSIDDFIFKIYNPIFDEYQKGENTIKFTYPEESYLQLITKVNAYQELIAKYCKRLNLAYVQFLIQVGYFDRKFDNKIPYGSPIAIRNHTNIINVNNYDSRTTALENAKQIVVSDFSGQVKAEYDKSEEQYKNGNKIEGMITFGSLIGATIITGLVTAETGFSSLPFNARVFYSTEKALSSVGLAGLRLYESGGSIDALRNGALEGLGRLGQDGKLLSAPRILLSEGEGYLNTLIMLGVMGQFGKLTNGMGGGMFTKAGIFGAEVGTFTVLGKNAHLLTSALNYNYFLQDEESKLVFESALNSMVDPISRGVDFLENTKTLLAIKATNAMMLPAYKGITAGRIQNESAGKIDNLLLQNDKKRQDLNRACEKKIETLDNDGKIIGIEMRDGKKFSGENIVEDYKKYEEELKKQTFELNKETARMIVEINNLYKQGIEQTGYDKEEIKMYMEALKYGRYRKPITFVRERVKIFEVEKKKLKSENKEGNAKRIKEYEKKLEFWKRIEENWTTVKKNQIKSLLSGNQKSLINSIKKVENTPEHSMIKAEIQLRRLEKGDAGWVTQDIQDRGNEFNGIIQLVDYCSSKSNYNENKKVYRQIVLSKINEGIKNFEQRYEVNIDEVKNITPQEKQYVNWIKEWTDNFNERYKDKKDSDFSVNEIRKMDMELRTISEWVKLENKNISILDYIDKKKATRHREMLERDFIESQKPKNKEGDFIKQEALEKDSDLWKEFTVWMIEKSGDPELEKYFTEAGSKENFIKKLETDPSLWNAIFDIHLNKSNNVGKIKKLLVLKNNGRLKDYEISFLLDMGICNSIYLDVKKEELIHIIDSTMKILGTFKILTDKINQINKVGSYKINKILKGIIGDSTTLKNTDDFIELKNLLYLDFYDNLDKNGNLLEVIETLMLVGEYMKNILGDIRDIKERYKQLKQDKFIAYKKQKGVAIVKNDIANYQKEFDERESIQPQDINEFIIKGLSHDLENQIFQVGLVSSNILGALNEYKELKEGDDKNGVVGDKDHFIYDNVGLISEMLDPTISYLQIFLNILNGNGKPPYLLKSGKQIENNINGINKMFGKESTENSFKANVNLGEKDNIKIQSDIVSFIVRNMLSNAYKVIVPGENIEVNISIEGDRMVLKISNNGIPMTPDQVNKINSGKKVESGTESTGLGIGMITKLLGLNGGTLSVTSDRQKTEFTITLPLEKEGGNNLNSIRQIDGDKSMDLVGGGYTPVSFKTFETKNKMSDYEIKQALDRGSDFMDDLNNLVAFNPKLKVIKNNVLSKYTIKEREDQNGVMKVEVIYKMREEISKLKWEELDNFEGSTQGHDKIIKKYNNLYDKLIEISNTVKNYEKAERQLMIQVVPELRENINKIIDDKPTFNKIGVEGVLNRVKESATLSLLSQDIQEQVILSCKSYITMKLRNSYIKRNYDELDYSERNINLLNIIGGEDLIFSGNIHVELIDGFITVFFDNRIDIIKAYENTNDVKFDVEKLVFLVTGDDGIVKEVGLLSGFTRNKGRMYIYAVKNNKMDEKNTIRHEGGHEYDGFIFLERVLEGANKKMDDQKEEVRIEGLKEYFDLGIRTEILSYLTSDVFFLKNWERVEESKLDSYVKDIVKKLNNIYMEEYINSLGNIKLSKEKINDVAQGFRDNMEIYIYQAIERKKVIEAWNIKEPDQRHLSYRTALGLKNLEDWGTVKSYKIPNKNYYKNTNQKNFENGTGTKAIEELVASGDIVGLENYDFRSLMKYFGEGVSLDEGIEKHKQTKFKMITPKISEISNLISSQSPEEFTGKKSIEDQVDFLEIFYDIYENGLSSQEKPNTTLLINLKYLFATIIEKNPSISNNETYRKILIETSDNTISAIKHELSNFDRSYEDSHDIYAQKNWLQFMLKEAKNIGDKDLEMNIFSKMVYFNSQTPEIFWGEESSSIYKNMLNTGGMKDNIHNRDLFLIGFLAFGSNLKSASIRSGDGSQYIYTFKSTNGDTFDIYTDMIDVVGNNRPYVITTYKTTNPSALPAIADAVKDFNHRYEMGIEPDIWDIELNDIKVILEGAGEKIGDIKIGDIQDLYINVGEKKLYIYLESDNIFVIQLGHKKIKVSRGFVKEYLQSAILLGYEAKKQVWENLTKEFDRSYNLGLLRIDNNDILSKDISEFFSDSGGKNNVEISYPSNVYKIIGEKIVSINIKDSDGNELFSINMKLTEADESLNYLSSNEHNIYTNNIKINFPEGSTINKDKVNIQLLNFILKSKYTNESIYNSDKIFLKVFLENKSTEEQLKILESINKKNSFPIYTQDYLIKNSPENYNEIENPTLTTILSNSAMEDGKRIKKIESILSSVIGEPLPQNVGFFVGELLTIHNTYNTPIFLKPESEIAAMFKTLTDPKFKENMIEKYNLNLSNDQLNFLSDYLIRSGLLSKQRSSKYFKIPIVPIENLQGKKITSAGDILAIQNNLQLINIEDSKAVGSFEICIDEHSEGKLFYKSLSPDGYGDGDGVCLFKGKGNKNNNDMYYVGIGRKLENGRVTIDSYISKSELGNNVDIGEMYKGLFKLANSEELLNRPKYTKTNVNFSSLLGGKDINNKGEYKKILKEHFFDKDKPENKITDIINPDSLQIYIPAELAIFFYEKYSPIIGSSEQIDYNSFIKEFKSELKNRFSTNCKEQKLIDISNQKNGLIYKMGQDSNGKNIFVRFIENNKIEIKKSTKRNSETETWQEMTMDHVVEVSSNIDKFLVNQQWSTKLAMDLTNLALIPKSLHEAAKNKEVAKFMKEHNGRKPDSEETQLLVLNFNGVKIVINDRNEYVLKEKNLDLRRHQTELLENYNKDKAEKIDPATATSEQWKEFSLWAIRNGKIGDTDVFELLFGKTGKVNKFEGDLNASKEEMIKNLLENRDEVFDNVHSQDVSNATKYNYLKNNLLFNKNEIRFLFDIGICGIKKGNLSKETLDIYNKLWGEDFTTKGIEKSEHILNLDKKKLLINSSIQQMKIAHEKMFQYFSDVGDIEAFLQQSLSLDADPGNNFSNFKSNVEKIINGKKYSINQKEVVAYFSFLVYGEIKNTIRRQEIKEQVEKSTINKSVVDKFRNTMKELLSSQSSESIYKISDQETLYNSMLLIIDKFPTEKQGEFIDQYLSQFEKVRFKEARSITNKMFKGDKYLKIFLDSNSHLDALGIQTQGENQIYLQGFILRLRTFALENGLKDRILALKETNNGLLDSWIQKSLFVLRVEENFGQNDGKQELFDNTSMNNLRLFVNDVLSKEEKDYSISLEYHETQKDFNEILEFLNSKEIRNLENQGKYGEVKELLSKKFVDSHNKHTIDKGMSFYNLTIENGVAKIETQFILDYNQQITLTFQNMEGEGIFSVKNNPKDLDKPTEISINQGKEEIFRKNIVLSMMAFNHDIYKIKMRIDVLSTEGILTLDGLTKLVQDHVDIVSQDVYDKVFGEGKYVLDELTLTSNELQGVDIRKIKKGKNIQSYVKINDNDKDASLGYLKNVYIDLIISGNQKTFDLLPQIDEAKKFIHQFKLLNNQKKTLISKISNPSKFPSDWLDRGLTIKQVIENSIKTGPERKKGILTDVQGLDPTIQESQIDFDLIEKIHKKLRTLFDFEGTYKNRANRSELENGLVKKGMTEEQAENTAKMLFQRGRCTEIK